MWAQNECFVTKLNSSNNILQNTCITINNVIGLVFYWGMKGIWIFQNWIIETSSIFIYQIPIIFKLKYVIYIALIYNHRYITLSYKQYFEDYCIHKTEE